jgi:hypothetical protein
MLRSEMQQRTAAATRRRGIVSPATFMCLPAQRQPARESGAVPSTSVAKQFDENLLTTHNNVAITTFLLITHFIQNNRCVKVLRESFRTRVRVSIDAGRGGSLVALSLLLLLLLFRFSMLWLT